MSSLVHMLAEAQRRIAAHPRVVAALISALAAEGRRFAATDEGRRCRAALLRSARLHRAQLVWDAFGLDRFARAATGFTPRDWIDLFAAAGASDSVEAALGELLVAGAEQRR
jgi:hypothetical protein